MRRGFSLPELVLVLALSGILLAIALPRLAVLLDSIEVHTAASRIAAAHQRARMMAVTKGQVLVLTVQQDSVAIRRRGEVTSLWSEIGPAAEGVALDGASRQFTFSPEGLTLGLSNATLRLSRGSATRAVVVSRLGRVRITR
jgi:prepilin-type N-terminal cleavage/methylation domain-containing protein